MKKLDKDRSTLAVVVPNDVAMSWKAGRYISIEKGLKAVSRPRIIIRKTYRCLVMRKSTNPRPLKGLLPLFFCEGSYGLYLLE